MERTDRGAEAVVTNDRPYTRERLRAFIDRLDDDALAAPVNEYWTVAGVLGHLAYWDSRLLVLAEKIDRGEPWVPLNTEPEGDWLTDSTRPIIHAIAPRTAAELALRIAEETDARVAELPWTGWLRPTRIVPFIQPAANTEVSTSTSRSELSATAAERRSGSPPRSRGVTDHRTLWRCRGGRRLRNWQQRAP